MNSKKHAYLIMAHNNFYCLEMLLRLLDDERNDIYLHIDKKVKNFDFAKYRSLCSRARVYTAPKRLDAAWGSRRLVLAEMILFRTAAARGPYRYYHLLSGADLPLKSQNEIHARFSGCSASFLRRTEKPTQWDTQRLSRYHNVIPGKNGLSDRLNQWLMILQERMGVDRLERQGIQLQKGSQWGSLTQEAVDCLLENEEQIRSMTRFSVCADEVYKQTVLHAKGCPMEDTSTRLTFWGEGDHPRVITMADMPLLESAPQLFARKFDGEKHRDAVDAVADMVMKREQI